MSFLAPSSAHHIKTFDKEQYNKYQINMPTNITRDSRREFRRSLKYWTQSDDRARLTEQGCARECREVINTLVR